MIEISPIELVNKDLLHENMSKILAYSIREMVRHIPRGEGKGAHPSHVPVDHPPVEAQQCLRCFIFDDFKVIIKAKAKEEFRIFVEGGRVKAHSLKKIMH